MGPRSAAKAYSRGELTELAVAIRANCEDQVIRLFAEMRANEF